MYQVLNEMPASPSVVNPSAPAAFDYIVARAMAKAPENRYQTAREMASDVRNFRDLTATSPLISASSGKKHAAKTGSDGDTTVILNASQITPDSRQSSWIKRAGLIVAAIFFVATILFITSSRESVVTTVDDEKPTAPQTPLVAAEKPPPPAEIESKIPDGQPNIATPTQATLGFSVLPWGEIFIDGKSLGASPPLREIRLPPGKHQIEIKNTDLPSYRQSVELEAGASKMIRHKFK